MPKFQSIKLQIIVKLSSLVFYKICNKDSIEHKSVDQNAISLSGGPL
jgi:hypothetical protein